MVWLAIFLSGEFLGLGGGKYMGIWWGLCLGDFSENPHGDFKGILRGDVGFPALLHNSNIRTLRFSFPYKNLDKCELGSISENISDSHGCSFIGNLPLCGRWNWIGD